MGETSEDAFSPPKDESPSGGKFPKAVFFILGNELCERFSYYGMRAVLTLYLTQQLLLERSSAKLIFHGFTMVNYFMPLFGGLLADIYLGKFRTILFVSLIYASGNVFLSMTSIPGLSMKSVPFVVAALMTIAVGSGGIKPCVVAFGGDQFEKHQEAARDKFFSIFYFCINLGAVMSMILSPIFRAEVRCMGERECYPLAFGFPAALMIVATIIFVCGKPLYKIYPPQGTAVADVARCVWHALRQRFRDSEKRHHWLDHADDRFDPMFIDDVKSVMSILLMFTPLPMFWALFDQQGSAWTLQSAQLDGRITKGVEVHPDQMDSINALLVIVFIPLFMLVIYPLLGKLNLLKRPLQKMATGGFLAALSFVLGGIIQLFVEQNLAYPPASGHADLMAVNTLTCPTMVMLNSESVTIPALDAHKFEAVPVSDELTIQVFVSKACAPAGHQMAEFVEFKLPLESAKAYAVSFTMDSDGNVTAKHVEQRRSRDPLRKSYIRLVFAGGLPYENATILLEQDKTTTRLKINDTFSDYIDVWAVDQIEICWADEVETKTCREPKKVVKFNVYKGGIFEALILSNVTTNVFIMKLLTAIPTDSLSMFWQVPMYVIITAGEIMLSITGLSFAYSQAPAGMKSVLQAAWLLTVATGNLIVMIVDTIKTALDVKRESMSFFTFSILMALDMLVFSGLAVRYKYRQE